ncbi:MAG: VOC family protein [Methanomassiliicoccales archaeon]|jgi:PhnB protein
MKSISPYLNFQGNMEEAFNFYKTILGGEFTMLQRFKDMPDMPGAPRVTDKDKDKILHVSLTLSNGIVIMGSDALESHGQKVIFGNSNHISVDAESEEEAERLFKGLSKGGKITMPLQKMFWGALYASFADKFGINWMVNFSLQQ